MRTGPRALLIIGLGHGSTHGLSSLQTPGQRWFSIEKSKREDADPRLNRVIYGAKLISFKKWDTSEIFDGSVGERIRMRKLQLKIALKYQRELVREL